MSKTVSELKTWKLVCEIRFPPAANFFDNRGKIASNWQWTSDLSEWRISHNQVIVHNKQTSTILEAAFKNATVTVEAPDDYAEFRKLATGFTADVLEIIKVKKIDRIGVRFIQAARRGNFKVLNKKMREKIAGFKEDELDAFGSEIQDVGLALTLGFQDNVQANFKMGPMKTQQLSTYFEAAEIKKRLPSVCVFIDFDVYKTNPGFKPESYKDEVDQFIKLAAEKAIDTSNNILDKLGGFT